MVLGRSTMVSGRFSMVLGRSSMVLGRSTMVLGRSTIFYHLSVDYSTLVADMFVLVPNLCVPQTTNNHPNIEPSRFLLMGLEVKRNLKIGNNPPEVIFKLPTCDN